MARPERGKSYLFVACKSCGKHFRVVDDPVFEGKQIEVRGPLQLKCRGCGAQATYATEEMRVYQVERRKKAQ